MIVLLGNGELPGPQRDYLPGPFVCPDHGNYRKAYAAMAEHAGLSLAQAVEKRYDVAMRNREAAQKQTQEEVPDGEQNPEDSDAYDGESMPALRKELAAFGQGPPASLTPSSSERIKWFDDWLRSFDVKEDPDPSNMTRAELLDLLDRRPDLMAVAQAHGLNVGARQEETVIRRVKVCQVEQLREAVEAVPTLKWSEGYREVCDQQGMVVKEDPSDGTSQVKFPTKGIVAWLPTAALIEVDDDADEPAEDGRIVRVAPVEELKPKIEATRSVKWFDRLAQACGTEGIVVREDTSDGTTQVRFPKPVGFTAWLPTCCLTEVDGGTNSSEKSAKDGEAGAADKTSDSDGGESSAKRQRTE
jgi:hypothetical protein